MQQRLRWRAGAPWLGITLVLFACQGSPPAAVENHVGRADAARLRAHVAWLADDAQEGRRAGTPGEKRSAEWIAQRLSELGLESAGAGGASLQPVQVPMPVEVGPSSSVRWDGGASTSGQVVPLFCSSGGSARGEIAFRGYGVINAENEWNDYSGDSAVCEGRVVVVVRGAPMRERKPSEASSASANVERGDGWGASTSLFMKVMNAKKHGAVAVLVAPHPSQREEPLPAFDFTRAAQAGIAALAIDFELARALVPDYEPWVAAIDAGRASQPASAAISVEVSADVLRTKGVAHNVLARLPGRDRSRAVLIGAHLDHLGRGGDGSLAPGEYGEIHNGADDNASGVAAVIEIARLLAAGPQPDCDVVFAGWSGEELGLLGSEHWAQHPTVPLENVVAVLNLDMVGRAGAGSLAVLGVGSAEPFESWLQTAGPRVGLDLKLNRSGQGVGGSDHQTFLKRKIPALHFFSGVHSDYHKPSDDVERFEADGTAKVVELCVEIAQRIAAAPRLAWIDPPAPEQGAQRVGAPMRVWFGTVPEYSYEGKGLLLADVSAGSPAEKAGMIGGDVLIRVGDVEIENIQDFMYALQTYKAGDVVLAVFLRDGVEESARVTLATRDAQ